MIRLLRRTATRIAVLLVLLLAACAVEHDAGKSSAVSGRLEAGLRVLEFHPEATGQHFTIYRGDYVRPELVGGGSFELEIPALGVSRRFPASGDESPYFKVPDVGRYEFTLGEAHGILEAIDLRATGYEEVTSAQAAEFIDAVDPLILDVRTPREYRAAHIPNAQLLPVQTFRREIATLQRRVDRDQPIFVYCQTGNRSTVAARMLIDAGFTRVVNLRRGIVEWAREQRPIVR